MQDFETPFNPHGSEPKVVQTDSGEVTVRPECCGSVCSPDCIVPKQTNDKDIVTLRIPVGYQAPDPSKEESWETVPGVGQLLKDGEIYSDLTLTVGQLKDLAISRIFVDAGNYCDTQAVLAQIRESLKLTN